MTASNPFGVNPSSTKKKTTTTTTTTTTTSISATSASASSSSAIAISEIQKLAKEMDDRASSATPFTFTELQELETSFRNVMKTNANIDNDNVTFEEKDIEDITSKLQNLLFTKVGHLSHKDWERTGQSASTLRDILLPSKNNDNNDDNDNDNDGLTNEFKYMFDRVIKEGNWDNAIHHAKEHYDPNDQNTKPWAVLVTGVNGIRKTTSVYQSWFPQLLNEALVVPSSSSSSSSSSDASSSEAMLLPTGHNSFFRQLDHMIATISNYNFQLLYQLTSQSHDFSTTTSTNTMPSKEVIQNYSNYKASIFKRYRTLSEILGVMLIRQAMDQNINVMIETSGRDVAMYHYIDTFFPADKYNKLVLHFSINDLSHAEGSVDRRMVSEMVDGVKVLGSSSSSSDSSDSSGDIDVRDLINVNAGGPYGSEVLKGIQEDSDAVWGTIVDNCKSSDSSDDEGVNKVGHDWYKASIKIDASADKDWTAKAVLPDGSDGKVFTFEAPRKV